MKIVKTVAELRAQVKKWRDEGLSVGLVPTMGYLHEGHGSLVTASAKENNRTVVSVFVNPTQFAPNEDLANYPRDLEKDSAYCEELGADLIFAPEVEEMYHDGTVTFINMTTLTEELCGLSRPIHFRGVCTVVGKLFNIVRPDRAYFGKKDAQQLAIIKRMNEDLNFGVEVIGCPIVREEDGLAKSSRNVYLTPEERKAAVVLSRSVRLGEAMVKNGETDAEKVLAAMKAEIETEPLAEIDYLKAVDGLTMQQVKELKAPALIAMAVRFGKARLLDNFFIE